MERLRSRLHRPVPDFLQVPWGGADVALFAVQFIGIQLLIGLLLHVAPANWHWTTALLDAIKVGEPQVIFIFNLIEAALGFLLISWCLHRYQVGWRELGWRRFNLLKAVGLLVAMMVLFFALAYVALILVTVLVPNFDANQKQTNDLIGAAGAHPSLALIGLVLLPPVLEESIFRGFMFPALTKRLGLTGAAVASSLVFALAHGQANVGVYTFILGLLLCFMYRRTGSIIPGIGLHMLNNYLALMALGQK